MHSWNSKAGYDLEGQRGNKDPYALAEDSADLENNGGQPFGSDSQSVSHVVIGTVDISLVEDSNEVDADDDAGNDGTDAPLEVGEVTT